MVRQYHGRNVWLIESITAICCSIVGVCCALCEVSHANAHARPSVQTGTPTPLTALPGDSRRGKAIAVDSDRGNCIICHKMPMPDIPPDAFGDLGPPLDGVGTRLSAAELRLRIIDARRINPETIMPPYQSIERLRRVRRRYVGAPILSAQDVEDLVAYLATLQ
jgi:L-cysteine S-thiosulfotransferase